MARNKETKRYWDIDFIIKYLRGAIENGSIEQNKNNIQAIDGIIQWVNDQRKITKNENTPYEMW